MVDEMKLGIKTPNWLNIIEVESNDKLRGQESGHSSDDQKEISLAVFFPVGNCPEGIFVEFFHERMNR